MSTITRYILIVVVAVMFAWGLSPNEVRAIATPCEQLALLDDDAVERMREVSDRLQDSWEDARRRGWDAQNAYVARCLELGIRPDTSLTELRLKAAYFRAWGGCFYEREARRLESAADELELLWNEVLEIESERDQAYDEWQEVHDMLDAIPERRRALMIECGAIQEMTDLMASFEHRVRRIAERSSVPGDTQMAQPENTANRESTNEQATQQLAIPTIPANLMFQGLSEATHQPGSAAAAPTEAQTQSSPAATGQVMQVQQQGSTNPGTSSFGYTHMSIPQNAGQSGAAVAPTKTLRAIPHKIPMRMQPGRSLKR